MANLVSSATGNFTAAGTWSVMDTTSFLNSETNSTASTTSFVSSSGFTPGAITIDGIGLKIASRTGAATGTFSVRLAIAGVAVTGTTVTTNAAAFSFYGNVLGWVFFKFSAPVTLVAATSYTVQIQSSVASTVTVYRDATAANWSRFLRTTTTQAPVAADYLVVAGEQTGAGTSNTLTVTMNNTAATNYSGGIEISANGTLAYGSAASTAYQLRVSNNILLNGGGVFTIGTLATPIPSTSSAALEFIVGSNVQFGLVQRGDSTFTTYGTTKTGRAYLNADAAAAATTITTDVSTAWKSGDTIAIASTANVVAQTESVTLSADATGTSVPVSALGFAHSGTNPTKAEVINLTRNVKIFGQSTSLQAYISLQGTSSNTMGYTECYFLGSGTGSKRGIDLSNSLFGSNTLTGCAFRNFEVANSMGVVISGAQNATLSDCVFYRISTIAVSISAATDTTVSLNNCWAMTNIVAGNNLFQHSAVAGSITNCTAVSATGYGFSIQGTDLDAANFTASNLTGHSCNTGGMIVSAVCTLYAPPTISNLILWRSVSRGLGISQAQNIIIDTITAFSNTLANVSFLSGESNSIVIKSLTSNAGTSPACPVGINSTKILTNVFIENSTFGATTTHSTGDIDVSSNYNYIELFLRNCSLNSATSVANLALTTQESFVASSRHQQTANAFTTFKSLGTITKDNVIYDTSNPTSTASARMTPNNATYKLRSADKRVIIPSGRALKLSVTVRQSVVGDGTAYNGSLPRLWVKKNTAVGQAADTLLATATVASSGAFEFIAGTTSTATDNGVLSFYVDVDGTTGWVNVDQWKVEVI